MFLKRVCVKIVVCGCMPEVCLLSPVVGQAELRSAGLSHPSMMTLAQTLQPPQNKPALIGLRRNHFTAGRLESFVSGNASASPFVPRGGEA